MKIYVASSWRNSHQPAVVKVLVVAGHRVYDFRHPAPGNDGFRWSDIDPAWKGWSPEGFRDALLHPIARRGFGLDMMALKDCEACVLVLPSGRSAHLEAGLACGMGKPVAVYVPEAMEPELMYAMTSAICTSLAEVVEWAEGYEP